MKQLTEFRLTMKNLIIALPFAGGNIYSYNNFELLTVPKYYNIDRSKHNITDIHFLVDHLIEEITILISDVENYYLYGHSMGGLIAFLVCRKLQERKVKLPKKLIISGRKAPEFVRIEKLSELSDELFLESLIPLGGIPSELLQNKEILDFFLPIIKHDFRILESYTYEPATTLDIPIDVFYGSSEAEESEMVGWHKETTEKVNITQLKGNHFFIYDFKEYFKEYFHRL
jgi:external thioesterase TEII